jgi:predicted Rossmann fold flavoprotein
LFCDTSSKDILAMLEVECADASVQVVTDCGIDAVERCNNFRISSRQGSFSSQSLVIATGGLSIPKMGASDFGYRLARQFGLAVLETRAGLVPFTFSGPMHDLTGRLAGVGVPATVGAGTATFTEDILFTHRGLSGPAALQASSYWAPGNDILIDLLPAGGTEDALLGAKAAQPRALLRTVLAEWLPRAVVIELQQLLWPDSAGAPLGEMPDAMLRRIAEQLSHWALRPAGTEGYRTAEVTMGGIDTDELSSQTMECKRQPGLYCIGEVVDVTGHLGGFNFQWAWSSAQAAGRVA